MEKGITKITIKIRHIKNRRGMDKVEVLLLENDDIYDLKYLVNMIKYNKNIESKVRHNRIRP